MDFLPVFAIDDWVSAGCSTDELLNEVFWASKKVDELLDFIDFFSSWIRIIEPDLDVGAGLAETVPDWDCVCVVVDAMERLLRSL